MINKQILFSLFISFLFFHVVTMAQDKKWEFNAKLAFGGEWSDKHWNGYYSNELDDVSLRAGIGVKYYFDEHWSIMPEVEIIGDEYDEDDNDLNHRIRFNNEQTDKFIFIDIPVCVQYRIQLGQSKKRFMVFGLGPSFNFTVKNNKYEFYDGEWSEYEVPGSYYDNRKSALNGKKKIKNFNIGIQPSVMYQFGHFQVGLEANFGLLDMNKKYGIRTGRNRINHIWPTFSYHF